ncbi:MAG: calcium-binding protein [Betaproteobacteria bacterium]
MRKLKRPALNRAREHRIEQEIVVDAYGPEEQAMGWYYYLQQKLAFPFKARCTAERSVSPLKQGEKVEVLAMTKEEDCMHEMFVLIGFAGRKLGVPLAQLAPLGADRGTREAIDRGPALLDGDGIPVLTKLAA